MPDYEKLYHLMVDASEKAIEALEVGNLDWAHAARSRAEGRGHVCGKRMKKSRLSAGFFLTCPYVR